MQPFIGMIDLFPFNFSPRGWAECNGKSLAIKNYRALFSLIGTTYGGDGKTHFDLPKIAAPVEGMRYCIALEGVYPPHN